MNKNEAMQKALVNYESRFGRLKDGESFLAEFKNCLMKMQRKGGIINANFINTEEKRIWLGWIPIELDGSNERK